MSTGRNLTLRSDGSLVRIGTDVVYRDGDNEKYYCCPFTMNEEKKYCINQISWPDGYWHRLVSPCLRLLIWCNVYHNDDTYVMGEPDYIYELANEETGQEYEKPIKWSCCGGDFVISEFAKSSGSDVECAPDGDLFFDILEDSNYFEDSACGILKKDEKHLIWGVVQAFNARAVEIKTPDDPDGWEPDQQKLGLAHMKLLTCGTIRKICCDRDFECD